MTKTERTCPRCGLVFVSEKLDGLCPACLFSSLFAESDADDSKAFWEEEESDSPNAEGGAASTAFPAAPVRRFSHFELLEELGRGGMGIVYRARDVGTGRIIALKVLQAHHLEVPDLVTRFRSEVRAVTSLDHPHVLPVHEVGEYEGIPFFSMKLTTGGSLAQRVGDFLGKPTEIARLLAKVARGVAHAHERGILHRDLKPGNILLDASGEPFVCDFGLAKWIEDDRNLTITAAVLGTPHYIAPEQASGQKGLTTAADIYSLGAILYELLTARPPFVGTSIIETLRLASENTPERPSSLAQNIPKDLETICLKCLEREPASRYPSATALAVDLENWLEGRPILARPVGAAEQLWRWARRNPLPAALIASVAMLLAATAVVATVSAVRIEKARDRAVNAEKETQEQLYSALIAQAKAARLTGRAGQRFDALDALTKAARIHPSLEVRNEAVAALALADIKIDPTLSWKISTTNRPPRAFDAALTHVVDEIAPGVVRVLRLADQREIVRLSESDAPRIEFIAHSGLTFIAVRHASGLIKVWDIETGRKLYELRERPSGAKASWYAFDCVFSQDARLLAVGLPEGGVSIHEAKTGRELKRLASNFIPGCLSFSPDGLRLALGSYRQEHLLLWDWTSETIPTLVPVPGPAYALAWSPDASKLAAGSSDMNTYVLSADGSLLGVCKGHRQEVTQVLFHPEGNRLITTSRDISIRLWSLSASTQSGKSTEPPSFAQEVFLPSHGGEPSMRIAQDGTRLALTYNDNAHIASLDSGERVCLTLVNARPPARATLVGSVDFSSDGRHVVTASYEYIDIWDTQAASIERSFDIDRDFEKSVRFGKNPDSLLVSSRLSGLSEYQLRRNAGGLNLVLKRVLDPEPGFILSNSPPGDASLVPLTSSRAGIAKLIDLDSAAEIFRVEGVPFVWDLAISPDRCWAVLGFSNLAAINQGDLQVWSVQEKRKEATLPSGNGTFARFSRDGRRLKSGSLPRVFSTETWQPIPGLDYGGARPVFFHRRNWVATISNDTIIVSDIDTGLRLFTLESPLLPASSFRVAISPDDRFIAAQSSDNTLLIWNLHLLQKRLGEMGLNATRSLPSHQQN
jgi:WD40 repeat protein